MSLAEKYFSKTNFEYVWKLIINTFVKKEAGKGLSENNYTDEEKDLLSTISRGANKTVVENVFSSISAENALSANKGRELNDKISVLQDRFDGLTYEDEVYIMQADDTVDDIPNNTVIAIFPDEEAEKIDWTNYYNKSEIDEIIIKADFKKGKSAYESAVEKGFEGTEEEWLESLNGKDFKYEDFTPEQLASLKGDQGDPFKYEDFTPEQLASLKGDQGDPFEFEDFTPEQLEIIKGDKGDQGDPFEFEDFTPEQLELIRGEKGDKGDPFEYKDFTSDQLDGITPKRGKDYWTTDDIALIRSYIDIEVSEVVDGSPELLDTLSELANAINNDPNFAVTIMELIGKKADKAEIPKIPDFPTSLPANGGNADTVDGKHIVVSSSIPTTNDTSIITIVI